jgi:hypothetical protein
MPRKTHHPAYRLHKARGCAVVTIAGKDHYLGTHDTPESWEKYHRLVAEWQATEQEPAVMDSTAPYRFRWQS